MPEVARHVSSAAFPRGSFIRIARNDSASSRLLRANGFGLSLPALIRLGFELCSTYGVATVGKTDFQFRTLAAPRLARFLDKAAGNARTSQSPKTLKHLLGSASPMEVTQPMLLCLRFAWAGTPFPALHEPP